MAFRLRRGGIHPHAAGPHEGKAPTTNEAISRMDLPERVCIPLWQGGAPCNAVVKKGDYVKKGQLIGEASGYVSAPVHASISGTVDNVVNMPLATGQMGQHVVILNDGKDEWVDGLITRTREQIEAMGKDEVLEIIQSCGLTGMGGASFPTRVKLNVPEGKTIDTLLINGAECEPYITADDRVSQEWSDKIVDGIRIVKQVLGVSQVKVCIEDNKPAGIAAMKTAVSGEAGMEVAELKTKYPQGSEKQLIQSVTKREVPSGGLPADVGIVMVNIGTCAAIADALYRSLPLIERVVTITGAVNRPSNLVCRIGTSFYDAIQFCGGYRGDVGKIISGGPMMGIAQPSDAPSIVKGTSGILVFTPEEAKQPHEMVCIRCAKCVQSCPMGLMPLNIDMYSRAHEFERADDFHAMDCMECGCCSYQCPSKRLLVQSIRVAKAEITDMRRKKAEAEKAAREKAESEAVQ
ncbi:electron transport complex subunit RsxC [Eubacteriales bacterium OttesenSCG-928-N14]|nr:electron transport complex subunit RsxC [Eubacteriales bacterium OttesenSCG-928-N14]